MDAVDSLRIVCTNLKEECANDEILKLRKRLNRAHVENCRLRKKAQQLETKLTTERLTKEILKEITIHLIKRMDSRLLRDIIEHE